MKKIVFLMLVMLSLFVTMKKDVTVNASESNLLNPVVKYEFKEGELGVDSVNGINLKSVGNPTAGEKGVILNGSSYLYATPTNDADITDLLDSFTVTVWAKEDSKGANHRFILGTGCAFSKTGFGMGFYSTNSAYIVPNGAAENYADNFVTSQSDSFGTKVPNYQTSTEWNLYTIMVKDGVFSYGVNGYVYSIPQAFNMSMVKNLTQTLTIGAVCSNDGTAPNNYFKGEIADVRIYNDYLSDVEFKAIFEKGIGGEECIYRSNDIVSIEDSLYTENTPYDFELEVDKFSANNVASACSELNVKVKLSDGNVVPANLVLKEISTISATEAFATLLLDVTGVANTTSKKVKVRLVMSNDSKITVNTTFTDNMVLQRNEKVKIFGYGGNVGGVVTVTFNGQTQTGVVDENGWAVYLDPMSANKVGSDLVITYNKQTITYKDVLVGEVLLCSGQSNMAITLQYIANKDNNVYKEYNEFRNYDNVRILDIPYVEASEPKIYETPIATWKTCSSVQESKNYSAYALAAAAHYQAILGDDVPVGVITAAVGGSCIEEWLDPASMKNLNSYAASMNKVDSRYYNGYIYNLGGYTLGGIVWYQGCANSQPRMVPDYIKQFAAYVSHYRDLFENEDLPIIVQQLVQHDSWVELAPIRQAQWDFMKTHKNVYTIAGIDSGSMEPTDGIHPADKWQLGERVAAALAYAKDMKKEEFAVENAYGISPEILSAKIEAADKGIKITFETTDDGNLEASGTVTGFQIKVNGIWKDVEAKVVNGILVIETEQQKISDIRYNYINGYDTVYGINRFVYNYEGVFVYNKENLPLAPSTKIAFTSDIEDQPTVNNYQTLIKIEAKYENMKTQYTVGEEIDYTGLYVVETYDNSAFDYDSEVTMTDLENYTITVTDAAGNKIKGAFKEEGTYTVTVKCAKHISTFEVNVGQVNTDPGDGPTNNVEPTPQPQPSTNGCGGSILSTLFGTIALCAFAFLFKRKMVK